LRGFAAAVETFEGDELSALALFRHGVMIPASAVTAALEE
jgi:hypothetical protein